MIPTTQIYLFISSPFGLIPKPSGGLRHIHHLSHPWGSLVNNFILIEVSNLRYITIKQVTDIVLQVCRYCVIIQKDIKNVFHNILVIPHVQWFLGFSCNEEIYQEAYISFDLATLLLIFNLFIEIIYWMLQSYMG